MRRRGGVLGLFNALDAIGLAENTIVLVLADRGDFLGERGLWYLSSSCHLVSRAGSSPHISTAQPHVSGVAGPAEYTRYEARTSALPTYTWIRRYTQRTSGAGH